MADDKSAHTTGAGATSTEPGIITEYSNEVLEFFDADSRNIGFRGQPKNTADHTLNYTVIPTPSWYPDSFLRSLKRNSYMKLLNAAAITSIKPIKRSDANDGKSLMFYNDNECGLISGLINNAVSTIKSSVMGQITSITSKVDSVASMLSSNDSNTTMLSDISDVISDPFISNQPMVIVYGIHTTEAVRDTIASLKKLIEGLYNTVSSENIFDTIRSWFGKSNNKNFLQAIQSQISGYAANKIADFIGAKGCEKLQPTEFVKKLFTDRNLRLHGIAEALLRYTVSGSYTMKCKLPYVIDDNNKSCIMSSFGESCWSGWYPTNKNFFNNGVNNGFSTLQSYTGLNLVWSTPLDWKLSPNSNIVRKRYSVCSLNFTIFNDTLEHLAINLAFIWMFGATTKATTDTVLIRPPYLYTVEIPGGFRYKYCICKLEITPIGPMRRLSNFSGSTKNTITTLFTNMFGFEVNPKAIEYVPDAYEVQIKFESVLPDIWNFIDSYLRDTNRDKPEIGEKLSTKLMALMGVDS